ncbi:unnamed protein product, partial [Mesorhabditis belari]|uniref:Phosphatidic acid phosphatase type 2/haloperoxidase domain-containing protein n=1 Tax=Mesorhabditis belari TaxID=2138241 RepID=A0AAF3FHX9_9BILA
MQSFETDWKLGILNSALLGAISLILLVGPILLPNDHLPVQRGFSCNDESIHYPYLPNTVSVPVCGIVALSITFLMVLLGEAVVFARKDRNERTQRYFLISLAVHNGYWLLGLQITVILTQIAKYSVGRLRPHFLAVCQIPNYNDLCRDPMRFVLPTEYQCTGAPDQVREARISFFSGHSVTITYCCFYAVLYLQARIGSRGSMWRGGLCVLQSFLLATALFICASRITDYWHHPTDVLTGAAFGVMSASWTAIVWAGLFTRNKAQYVIEFKTEKNIV